MKIWVEFYGHKNMRHITYLSSPKHCERQNNYVCIPFHNFLFLSNLPFVLLEANQFTTQRI